MPKRKTFTILGIDPGIERTGYGMLRYEHQRVTVVRYGRIETRRGALLPDRLLTLYQSLTGLLRAEHPDLAAVEELFFAKNAKTAMIVGQARGTILLACASAGVPVRACTPMQIKQATTGYGGASKLQVQGMLARLLGVTLSAHEDDAADALAVAWCCAQIERSPLRP